MSDSEKGLWDKKTPEEIAKDKYRFTGERYGFRGNCISQYSDWIPQLIGLYAFPSKDDKNIDDELS